MRALFCTSEIYPFLKTGGLGDVAAALPPALQKAGVDMRLCLPGYPQITAALRDVAVLREFPVYFGARDARILRGVLKDADGLTAYVLDAPEFWHRSGPYVDAQGRDWPDNHLRFAALCRMAADLEDTDPDWRADIIHGNDWQCGLIAPYAKAAGRAARHVMTIHNIAYQGLFPPQVMPSIGLKEAMYTMETGEFYGKIGYLKAGLAYADAITTVSPTYAREIQETDQGCGLQGFLKTKDAHVTGILNGIDTATWDPARDALIARTYTARTLKRRADNKAALAAEFGLAPANKGPIFGVVSRLGHQKGFDMLLAAAPEILAAGGALVVLGSGDRAIEQDWTALAAAHPGRAGVRIGYDEALAHRIQAGADVIAMPSRSEPCGLVQLYAMRYGALPFVRATGGLADTVADGRTGFVFDGGAEALAAKLPDIFAAYGDKKRWAAMQKEAMARPSGWDGPAAEYKALYERLAA